MDKIMWQIKNGIPAIQKLTAQLSWGWLSDWENPVFVPEIAPDGKEPGWDKEADVRADTEVIEDTDNGVINNESNSLYKHVAADVLNLA